MPARLRTAWPRETKPPPAHRCNAEVPSKRHGKAPGDIGPPPEKMKGTGGPAPFHIKN